MYNEGHRPDGRPTLEQLGVWVFEERRNYIRRMEGGKGVVTRPTTTITKKKKRKKKLSSIAGKENAMQPQQRVVCLVWRKAKKERESGVT